MSLSQCCPCLSCVPGEVLAALLPHLSGTVAEGAVMASGRVLLLVRPAAEEAACPACGTLSRRVHSRYPRRLRDAPAGGREVVIVLTAIRFRCVGRDCPKVTFAGQVPGLTSRFARRTPPLSAALGAAAAAAGGRAGARLAAALGMPASRHSMIRLLMALPVAEAAAAPRVLGIDDFALRRGRSYGTVLVDVESGRVVDLLADREAATVEGWLKAHPGAAVICRDRAGAYAEAARGGAPAAAQVADRWHLLSNLGERVRDAAARHKGCLAGPAPAPAPADPGAVIAERHAAVRALRADGKDPAAAAAALGITAQAAGRLWRAPDAAALLASARPAPGLDPFKPLLRRRWSEGITSIAALHAEIAAAGYRGSYSTTYGYASLLKLAAPPRPPAPPAPRKAAAWIMTRPAALDPADAAALAAILARCPELAALHHHVRQFHEILASRTGGTRLADWLDNAQTTHGQPELHSFANGIRRDYQAVSNGLAMPWSSGKVEGTVNKIKLIKRQAYGRAGLPLLRQRVLLANQPT